MIVTETIHHGDLCQPFHRRTTTDRYARLALPFSSRA